MEVELDGATYLVGTMKARQQRNVFRRILPFLAPTQEALGTLVKALQTELGGTAEEFASAVAQDSSEDDFFKAVGPLAKAIAALSDADADYIFETCLSVVRRKTAGALQVIITSDGSTMQFEDIKLLQQIKLTFYVLKENYADFFSALGGQ